MPDEDNALTDPTEQYGDVWMAYAQLVDAIDAVPEDAQGEVAGAVRAQLSVYL
jgi:hypothetical protein